MRWNVKWLYQYDVTYFFFFLSLAYRQIADKPKQINKFILIFDTSCNYRNRKCWGSACITGFNRHLNVKMGIARMWRVVLTNVSKCQSRGTPKRGQMEPLGKEHIFLLGFPVFPSSLFSTVRNHNGNEIPFIKRSSLTLTILVHSTTIYVLIINQNYLCMTIIVFHLQQDHQD